MDDDWIWPEFPNVGGNGSLYDLSDREEPSPRLWGMKSVSAAGARGLHRSGHLPV